MYRDTDNHFFQPQTNIQYGIERNFTFKKSVSQSVSFCICMSSILSSIVLPTLPLIVHRQSPSNVLSNASTVLLNIADVSFNVSSHSLVAENNNLLNHICIKKTSPCEITPLNMYLYSKNEF